MSSAASSLGGSSVGESSLEARVLRALVASGAEVLDLSAEGVDVRLSDGAERALRFGNLRRSLAVSPPERHEAVIARFVRLWLAAGPEIPLGEAPADRLFPRLLPPGGADGGLGAPWVERLAGGHLLLALCVDAPEAVQMVKLLDFPRWGLGVAAAKAAALDRLAARSAPLAELCARPDPLAPAEIELGDGYDASRLLLAHTWFPAARGVLAVAPCRDLLLLAPVSGRQGWEAALGVALGWASWAEREIHTLPYPLSPRLFWRSTGLLEPIQWSAGQWSAGPGERAALELSAAVSHAVFGEDA